MEAIPPSPFLSFNNAIAYHVPGESFFGKLSYLNERLVMRHEGRLPWRDLMGL